MRVAGALRTDADADSVQRRASIALVINQLVSTTLAAIFLPVVGKFGYATMFLIFAGFTVIYLLTAIFFLPETKGKTLEEIEKHFEAA